MRPGDLVYVEKWVGFVFLVDEMKLDSTAKDVGEFHADECGIVLNVEKQRQGRNVFKCLRVLTSRGVAGWVNDFDIKRVR